jgi:hypothetical protein
MDKLNKIAKHRPQNITKKTYRPISPRVNTLFKPGQILINRKEPDRENNYTLARKKTTQLESSIQTEISPDPASKHDHYSK